jgi:hypothetical protein
LKKTDTGAERLEQDNRMNEVIMGHERWSFRPLVKDQEKFAAVKSFCMIGYPNLIPACQEKVDRQAFLSTLYGFMRWPCVLCQSSRVEK